MHSVSEYVKHYHLERNHQGATRWPDRTFDPSTIAAAGSES
jgi:hypothetical protein